MANDVIIAHWYHKKEQCRNIGRKTSVIIRGFWAVHPNSSVLSSYIHWLCFAYRRHSINIIGMNGILCIMMPRACKQYEFLLSRRRTSTSLSICLPTSSFLPELLTYWMVWTEVKPYAVRRSYLSFLPLLSHKGSDWQWQERNYERILNIGKDIQVQSKKKDEQTKVYRVTIF